MTENRVEWPLWSKIYGVTVAAPMIAVCVGLAFWFVTTRIGGTVSDGPAAAVWTLIGTLAVAFVAAAWLFFLAVQRMIGEQNEALLFAATAHILIATPALVFLLVSLFHDPNRFVDEIYYAVVRRNFVIELKLALWMTIHIYLGTILALADRTST